MANWRVHHGDSLDVLRGMESRSVDLVMCSPPYEGARTYGIGFTLRGERFVRDWCLPRYLECVRVSRGLVAWVIEGQTTDYRWSAVPALLMAALHERGVCLRKPPAFHRVGIPGSGGKDWLRNDYEFVVCATNRRGRLPWSDNTAMGHSPKWGPGGAMSNRTTEGARVNQWGARAGTTKSRRANGERQESGRPSHVFGKQQSSVGRRANGERKAPYFNGAQSRRLGRGNEDGTAAVMPVKANPGNVIRCIVGGNVMGDPICHENEAPYPEELARFFVRSFCPPGGTVLDPFMGSGTTLDVAVQEGRSGIGIDVRLSQCRLAAKRMEKHR